MGDPLFAVRNSFWLGAYQTAISEASQITGLSEAQKIQRDFYVYRSYIELGTYELVLSEIGPTSPAALQAVRLLAVYLKQGEAGREGVLEQVAGWLADPASASNVTVLLVAATVYALEGNYVEALRICHNAASLELLALSVQVNLSIDRVDQAESQAGRRGALAAMSAIEDDSTLTQLAGAWVGTALGGAKVQEAFYIYSVGWAGAESAGAFEKNPKDADALANLVVVSLHLGKNAQRYFGQLKTVAPAHQLVRRQEEAEAAFDRAAAAVSA
eukprot:scaffold1.g5270.t1